MPTKTLETFGQKVALEALRPDLAVLIPFTVKDGFSCQKGDVLGLITSSGLARRRTFGVADGAGFATNSAVGVLEDTSMFAVGDVLKNAAGTTIGTIQAINSATQVTLTGNAGVAVADGAAVLGSDGSQVAKGIADEGVDGSGDTIISAFIAGLLVESSLRGLDSTAKAELGGVSVAGGIFKF